MQLDYLIVGQGLAGSILAHKLIDCGQRILVLDNQHFKSASHMAAGIINPISGGRLHLEEGFTDCFSVACDYYRQMEKDLGTRLLQTISQQRLLIDQRQYDYYQRRLGQSAYQPYLGEYFNSSQHFRGSEFGVTEVLQTALVDTKRFLAESKLCFQYQSSYRVGRLDYAALKVKSNGIEISDVCASNIIFCEGHQAIHNPWLKGLPFKLAKGEIITVERPHNKSHPLLNWGRWLLPTANQGISKLGSNFVWDEMDLTPRVATHEQFINSLQKFTTIKGRVVKAEVGIRPSTQTRTPLIGRISALENAYCFNGFGSKGCLQIPYYAQRLCDHLLGQKPLPDEVTQWL